MRETIFLRSVSRRKSNLEERGKSKNSVSISEGSGGEQLRFQEPGIKSL